MSNQINIVKAVKRLFLAKERNEKIVLWGDYDADGISGTLILYEGLKNLGFENLSVSLSGRAGTHERGEKEIEKFAENGISLIVSIDFGISANEKIKAAFKKGIDFIVLDHHTPSGIIPAGIIVNYFDGRYKNKSAAGVVFELVKKLYRQAKRPKEETEIFLDLVAVSIVSDKISLTKLNKKIIIEGVKRINRGNRAGLRALAERIKIKNLTVDNFENLVSRIDFPEGIDEENNLFRLMGGGDKKEIKKLVIKIEKHYQEAQSIIKRIFEKNIKKLNASGSLPKAIFVENEFNWPQPGISGLVANELVKKFNRPVFVYSRLADKIKSSGRAPEDFNLIKALGSCPKKLFDNFGGHPRAAGFKASIENFEKIEECLKKYFQWKK
ncbi:MAG: DHH family phosphoesterase [Patescibacteria group bacterium]